MSDIGRDELIYAREQRDKLKAAALSSSRAIAVLMEDRVRHLTALRAILVMTETGIAAQGGREVYGIARRALETEADMSWWPDEVSVAEPRRAEVPPGCVTADFQGPFDLGVEKVTNFVLVRLFRNPDVSVFVSDDDTAGALVAAFTQARALLAGPFGPSP